MLKNKTFYKISNKGSVLLAVVITLVVLSLVAMVATRILSTSSLSAVNTYYGVRAYYAAESGFRVLAGNYLEADSASAKSTVLETMHGSTTPMQDNDGSFDLEIYPYWFETKSGSTQDTVLAEVHGAVPGQWINDSNQFTDGGRFRLSTGSAVLSYTSATISGSGSDVTFAGVSGLASAPASGLEVTLAAQARSSAQTLTENGNLILDSSTNDHRYFPQHNGIFTIAGADDRAYIYMEKTGNVLTQVHLADQSQSWQDVSVPANEDIILGKFLKVRSTGRFDSASRAIIYNAPIGWVIGAGGFNTVEYVEKFDAGLPNWFVASNETIGTHAVETEDGGTALDVQQMLDPSKIDPDLGPGGNIFEAVLNAFTNWLASIVDAIQRCNSKEDNRLSVILLDYRNITANPVQAWNDSKGALSYDVQVKIRDEDQKYLMAGLLFRTRVNTAGDDVYTYGLSIVRGRYYNDFESDHCENWFIYPIICTKWVPYWDSWNADGGIAGLCGANFEDSGIFPQLFPDYDTPGKLYPSNITANSLPDFEKSNTNINYLHADSGTDCLCLGTHRHIYSSPALLLWQRTSSGFNWLAYKIIDDASHLNGSTAPAFNLKNWSTIMLRLVEGASLTFTSAGHEIKQGDIVRGASSNAAARVVQSILSAGTWGGSGSGRLVLSTVTGSFTSGESLSVEGASVATAGTYTAAKGNYIRVYYGDTGNYGTASSDQTNDDRKANVRNGDINWPPADIQDVSADNDYYTLVAWNAVNGPAGASLVSSTVENNAIVSTNALTSPTWTSSSPTFEPAEFIGLITSGYTGDKIYFDDFAIQVDIKSGSGFLPPVQQ